MNKTNTRTLFPQSIQKRLPLSYAGIALLVALSLGGVLVSTLFEYYRQQEIAYLQRNATIIQSNIKNMLEAGEPVDSLQAQLNLFAFLSRAHIELRNPDDSILISSDAVTSVLDVDQQQPGVRLVVRQFQDNNLWVGLPDTSGTDLTITTEIEDGVLVERIEKDAGNIDSVPFDIVFNPDRTSEVNHNILIREEQVFVNEAPGLYGFGLTATGENLSEERSSQVVSVSLVSSTGIPLGTLQVSEGPAYGSEIVTSVAWGWLFASLLSITLAIIVGYIISRNVSKPLQNLTDVTHQMTAGDFSVRTTLQRRDELGELATAFNAMADQIEVTMVTLNHFVSDAAHEINTPITALRTNLELITANQPDRAIHRALEQVTRLQHLTNGLLQLSRIESGEQETHNQAIHMQALIREVAGLYASRADQKNINLELSFPKDNIYFSANDTHIRIALSNLMDNAIKFTPSMGRVSIELEHVAQHVHIHVRDTGVGVPPDHMPYIFNRFHRAPNVADYDGSGLGLAIVHAVIERYQGHITVKNLEQGARFTLILPKY